MELKTPIHKLPSFINQLSIQKNRLEREITIKKEEYSQVIKENEIVIEELKEFRAKRHLLPKINDLQQSLNNQNKTLLSTTKELSDIATENYHLKAILAKDDILPFEFTEANKRLAYYGDNKPLDKKEIAAIVHEIYHYPSDHIDIIKTMRHWKKRQRQQQEQQQQQYDEIAKL